MAQPAVPSAASATLDSLLKQSIGGMQGMERPATCCCGRENCAYLVHNNEAMEGLEKDLQSAAQIGQVGAHLLQSVANTMARSSEEATHIRTFSADFPLTFPLQALLCRHEAYMAEAEEERRKMGASIDRLEEEKEELEAANAKTIEENRYLLEQLEEINNIVSNADAEILSLNTTLESTRKELERLTVLAAQTSQLEAQLSAMEREQDELQKRLARSEGRERTTVQRWKGAERTINTLQEQVDRIEREAREERARHADVLARFERRRAVERELESAAGRLKDAAATTRLERNGSNSVVSHFVKDILQDNANLQLGIVQLREILMGSNEEVDNLREQMMLHQPTLPQSANPGYGDDLNTELLSTPTREAKPDFHVHHHYHAAAVAKVARDQSVRAGRHKKRRNVISSGIRTPSSGTHTPRTPGSYNMRPTPVSSAATILSQTSVSIPPPSQPSHPHRWSQGSLQAPSSTAASSLPSSPSSAFQDMSLFDRTDDAMDSSRPTTPGSTTFGSPYLYPRRPKRDSDLSFRSLSAYAASNAPQSISGVLEAAELDTKDDFIDNPNFPLLERSTILEEPEDDFTMRPSTKCSSANSIAEALTPVQTVRPRPHRASSHESILSIHDLSMPKFRTKSSQYFVGPGFNPRTSLGASTATAGPVTSSTEAVPHRSNRNRGYNCSDYNRLLLGGAASTSPPAAHPATAEKEKLGAILGKRVGGWMLGRWGIAPASSAGNGNLRANDSLIAVAERAADAKAALTGSVEGKKAGDRLGTHVEAVRVDSRLLQETLGDG